ncbi:hypothetical protein [Falsiroseomonas sp.]|uniref:hypothetical protein n=1 Tax=Falsiroseomonas sp. TaxID=2870721 RepID=UPI0035619CA9
MQDENRKDAPGGAEDALRPQRPGGEPKTAGETDQRPDPTNAIPQGGGPQGGGRETNPGGVAASEASRSRDDRAAGTVDDPIASGDGFGSNDFQTGDRNELASQRGGPVDVSRDRPKRR